MNNDTLNETGGSPGTSFTNTRKAWETPSFERYDINRETEGKFATTTEYSPTTGPAS